MNIQEKKKSFFELGKAFFWLQYSEKPESEVETLETIDRIASSLKLEALAYDDLKNQPEAPDNWFTGQDSDSLKNCYQIGRLSYGLSIAALKSTMKKESVEQLLNHESSTVIIERLKIFFTVEDIPAEILDDHLTWLKTEDPLNAFRKFEIVFRKALSDKDTEPNEKLFKESKAKIFFELGIAFAQFSATPNDTDKYEQTRRIASSLELELPDHSDLKNQPWWEFVPPAKWFTGSNGELFKNCYEIGQLSYLRFLLALPPSPNTRTEQIDETVRQLEYLFEVEDIPAEILNDYLTGLETGDADRANASLRTFWRKFSIVLHEKATKPNEEIFNNPGPAPVEIFNNLGTDPSAFKKEVLAAFHLTINEASKCYKHECYLATIVLCGRIIETLIANAYIVVFGVNPLDTKIAFKDMRTKLKNEGVPLEETIDAELEVIYKHRNAIAHESIRIPTKEQAAGIALLTQNTIDITFRYFNDLAKNAIPQTGTNPTAVSSEGDRSSRNLNDKNAELTSGSMNQAEVNQVAESSPGHQKRYRGQLTNLPRPKGSINSDAVEGDIFVRRKGFPRSVDINSLREGQAVVFSIVEDNRGWAARNVVLAEDEE